MRKILIFLLMLISSAIQATTYYVSSTGSDAASGTTEGTAWQTLTKVNATAFAAGDQILFKKGDSFIGSIVLTRSGTAGNLITYGAYGTGANPIITGFTSVTAWTNLGSNIWESTNAVSTLSTLNMVVINGVNTAMGRYPNSDAANGGYLTYQSHSGKTSITSSSLTGTPNWTGAEAVIKTNHFSIDRAVISSQSVGTLNLGISTIYEPSDNFGFFIQNDVRTLDVQNEWYYNPTTKKIRIYSTSQPTNVKVATVDYLVEFKNIVGVSKGSYTTIQDITLEGSNKSAFYHSIFDPLRNSITVKNCTINYSGVDAIQFDADNAIVDGNTITNTQNKAIALSFSKNVTIKNNAIQNTGVLVGMGVQDGTFSTIHVGSNSDITPILIEYNTIINSAHNGITFGANGTTIRYNYINTFCTVIDDGAAIYGGNNANITYNVAVNGIGNSNGTYGTFPTIAAGVYLDYNSANCEIGYNSISDCAGYGIFNNINVGNMNIHHNTVFNCSLAQIRINNKELAQSYGFQVNNNICVSKESNQLCFHIYGTSVNIPLIGTINNNIWARPIDDNVTFDVYYPGSHLMTFEQWKTFSGHDANSKKAPITISTVDDIQFVYNATSSVTTVALNNPSIDFHSTANKYVGSVTLQPYTSMVLLKDPNPATPAPVNKRHPVKSGTNYYKSNGYYYTL